MKHLAKLLYDLSTDLGATGPLGAIAAWLHCVAGDLADAYPNMTEDEVEAVVYETTRNLISNFDGDLGAWDQIIAAKKAEAEASKGVGRTFTTTRQIEERLIVAEKALAELRTLIPRSKVPPPLQFDALRYGPTQVSYPTPNSDAECMVPPPGWKCSRGVGHGGPCAATLVCKHRFEPGLIGGPCEICGMTPPQILEAEHPQPGYGLAAGQWSVDATTHCPHGYRIEAACLQCHGHPNDGIAGATPPLSDGEIDDNYAEMSRRMNAEDDAATPPGIVTALFRGFPGMTEPISMGYRVDPNIGSMRDGYTVAPPVADQAAILATPPMDSAQQLRDSNAALLRRPEFDAERCRGVTPPTTRASTEAAMERLIEAGAVATPRVVETTGDAATVPPPLVRRVYVVAYRRPESPTGFTWYSTMQAATEGLEMLKREMDATFCCFTAEVGVDASPRDVLEPIIDTLCDKAGAAP